jgi:hypothetical protein
MRPLTPGGTHEKRLIALAMIAAITGTASGHITDLQKVQKLTKRFDLPFGSFAPTKVGCACQGGALDTRVGILESLADPNVGAFVGCYALDFDGNGTIMGKTRCVTYVVLPK